MFDMVMKPTEEAAVVVKAGREGARGQGGVGEGVTSILVNFDDGFLLLYFPRKKKCVSFGLKQTHIYSMNQHA